MNINFEAIEKAWFKPKNKILFTKEELELLEDVFGLAIDECPSEDVKKINELEQKIKIYSGAWFKPKKDGLDELEEWVYRYREEHKNDTGIFDKFLTTGDVLRKIRELKNEVK